MPPVLSLLAVLWKLPEVTRALPALGDAVLDGTIMWTCLSVSRTDPPVSVPTTTTPSTPIPDRVPTLAAPHRALPELAELLLSTASVEEFLDDLARAAGAAMTPPASCGITLRRDHRPLTVASSDSLALALDEAQYERGEGPCLEAMRTGTVVAVTDITTERRWGGYPAHAQAHGVDSSLSLPLTAAGRNLGALNLYSSQPHACDDPADIAHGLALAGRANAVLGVVLHQADQVELTGQLRDAKTSRSVIDQALGIVMAQQRCTATDAFKLLRAASNQRNRKLRDVAADIITNTSGEAPAPSRFDDGQTPPDS